jgi:hypothetical protein
MTSYALATSGKEFQTTLAFLDHTCTYIICESIPFTLYIIYNYENVKILGNIFTYAARLAIICQVGRSFNGCILDQH